jgi:hypothetical protein
MISPELVPSTITLRAYDNRPSSPEGLFQNVPIELGGKIILINIEVIDAPLDYNILFRHSYMYAMKVVASSVFHILPTLITSSPSSALAQIIFQSSTWVLEYSRTHTC